MISACINYIGAWQISEPLNVRYQMIVIVTLSSMRLETYPWPSSAGIESTRTLLHGTGRTFVGGMFLDSSRTFLTGYISTQRYNTVKSITSDSQTDCSCLFVGLKNLEVTIGIYSRCYQKCLFLKTKFILLETFMSRKVLILSL